MNRDEVRKLASSLGIKRVSSYTKPQLEEMIAERQALAAPEGFEYLGSTAEGRGAVYVGPAGTPEPRFDRNARPAQQETRLTYPETFPIKPDDRPGRGKFGKDPERVAAERARRYSRS